ncbi:polyphosphate kinase 2 family protein, partial [Clostridium perfringens]|nr:polyphosphate kinase 2 family protein [Clostridium perfringens]
AAGKDGMIKRVMSGLNPQGTQVFSFKQPSTEELDHGYLWRIHKAAPERGRIGIFNRSHYEDVLVVRVHNYLEFQKVPDAMIGKNIWQKRFEQINNF